MTFGADCGRQTVMIIQEVADMKIAVCIKQVPDTDDVKICLLYTSDAADE